MREVGNRSLTVTALKAAYGAAMLLMASALHAQVWDIASTVQNLVLGDEAQLTAVLRSASGDPLSPGTVAWTSKAADIVSVDANGKITGLKLGTAVIQARSSIYPSVFGE